MSDTEQEAAQELERAKRRAKLEEDIQEIYKQHGLKDIKRVEAKNVLIIGRTRTGKSTIKDLLVEPTKVQSELTIVSETRRPTFGSYVFVDAGLVLHIIDTPGIFERNSQENLIRSDEVIMESIVECVNLEITKFHLVCFAFSMVAGIQRDDMDALKLFMDRLGVEVSENSCLIKGLFTNYTGFFRIVTRCESKTSAQREKLKKELLADTQFKQMAPYFKQGIFFTGSINPDDFHLGESSVIEQFKTILKYREILIRKLSEDIRPFHINESCISDIRRIQEDAQKKIAALELDKLQTREKLENMQQIQRAAATAQQAALRGNDSKPGCILS